MNENSRQIGGVSRVHFEVCAAITGMMALVLLVASIYAYAISPRGLEIPVYLGGILHHTEGKLLYLLPTTLAALMIFSGTTYPLLKWKTLARKPAEYFAIPVQLFGTTHFMNIMKIMQFNAFVFCAVGGFVTWQGLLRVIDVLQAVSMRQ